MAFNLQLPNDSGYYHTNWLNEAFRRSRGAHRSLMALQNTPGNMYDYMQKIGYISPSLCFQTDVFYPNVLAAVSRVSCEEDRLVLGCYGNQVQKDFPLEPRIPVAVPLVQYPTNTSEYFFDKMDICAKPVLNWEKYILFIKKELLLKVDQYIYKYKPLIRTLTEKQKLKRKKRRWDHKYEHVLEEDRPPIEDMPTDDDSSSSNSDYDDSSSSSSSDNESDSDSDTPQISLSISRTKPKKRRKPTFAQIRSKLFRNPVDLELTLSQKQIKGKEELLERRIQGKKIKPRKRTNNKKPPKLKLGWIRKKYAAMEEHRQSWNGISVKHLRKFKSQPKLRVEGTWNYVYGGANGSCCYTPNQLDNENINLYVGNRSQLRKLSLVKTPPASILSYKLESIWEEELENVPTVSQIGHNHTLKDIIFQIIPLKKFDILGVRRGKSIDLYNTDQECPYLLDSIPQIEYGTTNKTTRKDRKNLDFILDPLLLGLDFNPQYGPEFITINENAQIRIWDVLKRKTISKYCLSKSPTRARLKLQDYPKFRRINDASGISFENNGQIFLAWGDSKVALGDRRENSHYNLIDIFDLKRSVSSLAWSDQTFFNDVKPELNEYISSMKKSKKDYYYYLGTTSRILLMDTRVPGQPVLKLEHGMRSAAAYLDTYTNDSFEVLVATSQRLPTTVCAITDQTHISCFNRPKCEARNPILYSLPRHLSSSREFFDATLTEGYGLTWEADHQRALAHNYAWTTGLAICKGPNSKNAKEPPGILCFTSNCYGDVFYQEWGQKPLEHHKKYDMKDYKVSQFLQQWKDSMKSKSMEEFQKPTLNPFIPVDCSLLVEPCARKILRMDTVRQKPFDSIKPNEIHHRYVEETQRPFEERLAEMRKYKSDLAHRVVDSWEKICNNEEKTSETICVKEEVLEEEEMQSRNASCLDETNDIEFIDYTIQQAQELVELETQIVKEVADDCLSSVPPQNNAENLEPYIDNREESEDEDEQLLSIQNKSNSSSSSASSRNDSSSDYDDNESNPPEIDGLMNKLYPKMQPSNDPKEESDDENEKSLPFSNISNSESESRNQSSCSDDDDDDEKFNAPIESFINKLQPKVTKNDDDSYEDEETTEKFGTSQPEPVPTSSRSPDMWSQSQLYNTQNENSEDNMYGFQYDYKQRSSVSQSAANDEDVEFGDFIPSSQPIMKSKSKSRKLGF